MERHEKKFVVEVAVSPTVKVLLLFKIECYWWQLNPFGVKSLESLIEYQRVIFELIDDKKVSYENILLYSDDISDAIMKCFFEENKCYINSILVGVNYMSSLGWIGPNKY